MKHAVHIILALMLLLPAAHAQQPWKRVAAEDGILVYARAMGHSKIKAMKAECMLDASKNEVVDLLLDVKAAEQWVCHTKSCTLLRKISDSELLYHTEVNLPWPLDNRDFVTHLKVLRNEDGTVVVESPAVPGFLAARKGVVRVTHSVNKWLLRPQPGGKLWVEYTLQVDPGGHIPAHIVNMFACRAPIETFGRMRKILAERARQRSR